MLGTFILTVSIIFGIAAVSCIHRLATYPDQERMTTRKVIGWQIVVNTAFMLWGLLLWL